MQDTEKTKGQQPTVAARIIAFFSGNISRSLYTLVACATLPSLLIIYYNGLLLKYKEIAEIEKDLYNITIWVESLQSERTNAAKTLAKRIASLPEIINSDVEKCNTLFERFLREKPELANIVLLNSQGMVQASSLPFSGDVDGSDRTSFKDAVRTMDFSAGDYSVSRVLKIPVMQFSYPVTSAGGTLVGVVIISYSLNALEAYFRTLLLPLNSRITLHDRNGVRLLSVQMQSQSSLIGEPMLPANWRRINVTVNLSASSPVSPAMP